MDYASLINLILVTVVYSTFIAPNLQKLSQLKEDILNVSFPSRVSDEGSADEIKKNGVVLSKKMTQYGAKYVEIRNFLRFFYGIIATIVLYQTWQVFFAKTVDLNSFIALVASVAIVAALVLSLKLYMLPPWRIRSLEWLSIGGIAPVYLKHIFNPTFVVNSRSSNTIDSDDKYLKFSLRSDVRLTGFHYVVTVESLDSRYLYHVSAGKVTKYYDSSTLSYTNGQQAFEVVLGRANVAVGEYKVRLLLVDRPFVGKNEIYEEFITVNVTTSGASQLLQKIRLGENSAKDAYSIILNKKMRITSIDLTAGTAAGDESIEKLLRLKRFVWAMGHLRRCFEMSDPAGLIDKVYIGKFLSRRYLFLYRFRRLMTRRKILAVGRRS